MTESKKRKGRKPIVIDNKSFMKEYKLYASRKITKYELAERFNISRPTLDRILKEKGFL